MKIIFFGTPEFSGSMLTYLIQHGVEIAAVITKPDRPKGRSGRLIPTPVKQVVQSLSKQPPLYQPPIVSAPSFAPTLAAFNADLFVVVAYGEIIKQHLLDMPKYGCINVHASILPKHRGAAPIQRAIIAGEKETGVTIMQMVRKMDAGDIISTACIPIDPEINYGALQIKLCEAGSPALLKVIKAYQEGLPPPHFAQDETLATYAGKIELEECEINWNEPAQKIHDLIRGVNPEPGAWSRTILRGEPKRLRIHRSRVVQGPLAKPGTILEWGGGSLRIRCGTDALEIIELQLEGKKAMESELFMRGTPREAFTIMA